MKTEALLDRLTVTAHCTLDGWCATVSGLPMVKGSEPHRIAEQLRLAQEAVAAHYHVTRFTGWATASSDTFLIWFEGTL